MSSLTEGFFFVVPVMLKKLTPSLRRGRGFCATCWVAQGVRDFRSSTELVQPYLLVSIVYVGITYIPSSRRDVVSTGSFCASRFLICVGKVSQPALQNLVV